MLLQYMEDKEPTKQSPVTNTKEPHLLAKFLSAAFFTHRGLKIEGGYKESAGLVNFT